jgi:hypothetical protein
MQNGDMVSCRQSVVCIETWQSPRARLWTEWEVRGSSRNPGEFHHRRVYCAVRALSPEAAART